MACYDRSSSHVEPVLVPAVDEPTLTISKEDAGMVSLTALWLPIVVSAVLVFIASSIIHMVLTYHRSNYKQMPNEEKVLAAMRDAKVPPGNYGFPWCASPKEMGSPEMTEKYNRGPVGLLTVMPSGPPAMGKHLALWFVFCLVIGIFAAYLAGRLLAPGADYLTVFRVTGTVAFLGHGVGKLTDSIWMGVEWSSTLKHTFDGLVYALLTAGVFGWLWPA